MLEKLLPSSEAVYEQYGEDPRVVAGLPDAILRKAQTKALAASQPSATVEQVLARALTGQVEGARATDLFYS